MEASTDGESIGSFAVSCSQQQQQYPIQGCTSVCKCTYVAIDLTSSVKRPFSHQLGSACKRGCCPFCICCALRATSPEGPCSDPCVRQSHGLDTSSEQQRCQPGVTIKSGQQVSSRPFAVAFCCHAEYVHTRQAEENHNIPNSRAYRHSIGSQTKAASTDRQGMSSSSSQPLRGCLMAWCPLQPTRHVKQLQFPAVCSLSTE